MKRGITFCVLVIVWFALCAPCVSMAYETAEAFCGFLRADELPEGTASLDLLLPLAEDDECFVPYNRENGEEFGIAEDAEIVRYCEDGYRSYTYHYKDAYAEPVPRFNIGYSENSEFYEAHKEQYLPLERYRDDYSRSLDLLLFDIDVLYGSEEEQTVRKVFADMGKHFPEECTVRFCKWGSGQFEEIREKCSTAKIAFLDREGNVLAVTNAEKTVKTSLWKGDLQAVYLDGTQLSFNMNWGISPFAVAFFVAIGVIWLFFLNILACIVLTVVLMKKRKRGRSVGK